MNSENDSNKAKAETTKLRWPAAAAICVAVLLPLTAFAGIGGWNGVQKVMLGTAIELAAPAANETAEPRGYQAEESRSERSRNRGPAGFLGVSTTSISSQLREHFGVPEEVGVMVSNVSEDSAAYQAGLQAGDVITAIDGTPIDSGSDLRRAIRRAGADTQVAIEIYRDGQPLELGAMLGAAESRQASFSWTSDNDDWDQHGWSEEDVEKFTERMEAFGERMADWGERFGEDFGEEWATQFEQNGEEFGRRMEAWGEEFGRRIEERFENGDWENNFRFDMDGEWDAEAFEDAMKNLNIELESLDLEGLGTMIEDAMQAIDFDSLGETISDAVERAMETLDDHGNRE